MLIKTTFCLYKKHYASLFCKLCLYKQLGVLSEKVKKMLTRKLAFIENLKRLKQGVSGSVGALITIEAFELMANSFDGLFDSFSLLALTFFVNISQSFEPSLS